MKTISDYQRAKQALKNIAYIANKKYPTDKPKIRMLINDEVDYLSKNLWLTEHQRNLLSNYACKLHPKD